MGHCGGLISRVHPRILPRVYPRGIVSVRPRITSFTLSWTTFKLSGDILFGSLEPLSCPCLPNSHKSSLICKTLINWHQVDWWDFSHPHVYFNRQVCQVSGHQQDWKDDKLCHDVLSDTAPNHPTDVITALSLLCNHHYSAIITTRANSVLLSPSPPLNTIKTLL